MNTGNTLAAKQKIQRVVDQLDRLLREIALNIHAHPELGYQEHKAVQWLTAPLREAGFSVETGIAGLETAFMATWEGAPGGPTIGLLAEYDALPGLGHACGHNLIGTAAVGAALALKEAYPDLPGKVKVIGCPAEEGGGGKIYMCEQGVFDDLDAAMMCHPKNSTMVLRGGLARVSATFKFYGKESHASSAPEKGISALDALVNSFVAINSLRQFFTDNVRIHGIVTKGGDAPNIVPAYCEAKFLIRCATRKELEGVKQKVYAAARNAAAAVGARCEIEEGLIYAERNNNVALAQLFRNNLELMGIEVQDPPKQGGLGSSDIGNVGQVTATIHPYIKIGEAANHTPEFAEEARSEGGMVGLNQAAKALAMTTYDLCTNAEALQAVRQEFANWKKQNSAK
ncbi:M20 family metallopeptidase [Brevibacillus marinus]|uniref:M20 family metallopeptidase n=1 Tax=Brevibacillus marinus TaxID=2496837 RepID=UPI000F848A99|nr:M20 family metallopeptidase [Brevibacillus marinus]